MNNDSILVVSCDPCPALHSMSFGQDTSRMVRHQFERGIDCMEALTHYDRLNECVIVVDSRVQDMPSLNVVDAIRTGFPQVGIVVVLEESSQDLIQRAMLAGAKGAVLRNCTVEELLIAADRVSGSQSGLSAGRVDKKSDSREPNANHGAIVGVFGAHGGSGKTTTSLSVATVFAQKGLQTLFLDFDCGFGDSINVLPTIYSQSLRDFETQGASLPESQEELHLASNLSAVRLSRELSESAANPNALARILDDAKQQYEVVVFNTGTYTHLLHADLIRLTQQALCLFDHTIPSIRSAQQLMRALSYAEIPSSAYRFVVNRFSREGLTLSDIESALGGTAVSSIPLLGSKQVLLLDTQSRPDFLRRRSPYATAINELCELIALAAGIHVRSSEEIRVAHKLFKKDKVAL